jgi:hypothetical protein
MPMKYLIIKEIFLGFLTGKLTGLNPVNFFLK